MKTIKRIIKKTLIYIIEGYKGIVYGKKHFCISCNRSFYSFKPYLHFPASPLFEKNNIIGAGFRKNYLCPYCGSIDRIRWQQYVIKNYTDIFANKNKVLHFAPERALYKLFTNNKEIDYFPCDIKPADNWYKVDITKIPFDDNSFDFVISNHVLEHIQDEKKAVSEIKRVLKPEGTWMFSFPIRTDENTIENESIINPEERLKVFGQSDHVRLYGKDYKKRFENYGIKLQEFKPIEVMNENEIEKNGFIPNDTILIGRFE